MPEVPILLLILGGSLAVWLRMRPRIQYPWSIAHDTYFHLFAADEIRENGMRVFKHFKYSALPQRYAYPFLYHYFLAAFPSKIRPYAERFTGAFFDGLNLLILTFGLWMATPNVPEDLRWQFIVCVVLMVAFSPLLLRLGYGPRAYHGSPRVFGQTLYSAHLFFAWIAINNQSWVWAAASAALAGTQFISSKFSLQVLVFFAFLFSALWGWGYPLIVCVGFLGAALLTRGHSLRILTSQIRNMRYYFLHLQRSWLFKDKNFNQTLPSYVKRAYGEIAGFIKGVSSWKQFSKWLFEESFFLHIAITAMPFVLISPFLISSCPQWIAPSTWAFWQTWACAGLVWFVLTKWKYLLFIGEAERYLEYSIMPCIMIVSAWVVFGQGPIYLVGTIALALYLLFSLYAAFYMQGAYSRQYGPLEKQHAELGAFFETANAFQPGIILAIGDFWQAYTFSNQPILTLMAGYDGKIVTEKVFQDIFADYPFPNPDILTLQKTYGIRYVFSNRSNFEVYQSRVMKVNPEAAGCMKMVHESSTYVLAELRPLA